MTLRTIMQASKIPLFGEKVPPTLIGILLASVAGGAQAIAQLSLQTDPLVNLQIVAANQPTGPTPGALDLATSEASGSAAAKDKFDDGAMLTLNLQNADILALINTVSEITGKNFIIDPRVKGKVTLISGSKLPARHIYDIFLSVLQVHNLAAVQVGDVIKIIPSALVKTQPTRTVLAQQATATDEQLTEIFRPEHISVQDLVAIIRPLLPATSHFATHVKSNTMIITDTGINLRRVTRIIKQIDIPGPSLGVHVVFLKYAQAAELAPILVKLSSQLPVKISSTLNNPQALIATTLASPPAKPGTAVIETMRGSGRNNSRNISIQVDKGLNSLVIQAVEDDYTRLRAVIDSLDIKRPPGGDIRVIYLKYAQAKDLVTILSAVVKSGTAQAKKSVLAIQADKGMNALIIKSNEDQFRTIESVVKQLDIRRKQVYVKTIIAEVSTTKAADLGVRWKSFYRGTDGSNTTVDTSFSPLAGGITVGVLGGLIKNIAGKMVPNLNIVLKALRSDVSTNILSTPNLLTLDNQSAEIVVGKEVPFVTGKFLNDASASFTAGNSTGTTSNTGGTSTTSTNVNPFQTIERKQVGLTLKVTPHINADDSVQLEVEQEVSNISRAVVQGAADVVTDKRSLKTTVQISNNKIIVLGGLIRDDDVDSVEKVPLLGDIPIIGALFRQKSKKRIKTNLMVFMQPIIIHSTEELAAITKDQYDAVLNEQKHSAQDSQRLIRGVSNPQLPRFDYWDNVRAR